MAIIEARGLTRAYGALTAVEALDLDVREGSVTGFLGRNGAGKTTTIRMLLGLVHPTAGTVRVCGQAVTSGHAAPPYQVAAIIEGPAFYGALSATENLRVLTETAGLRVTASAIEAMLERVGLGARGAEPVRGFSLGMKQRLGVASVLIHSPKVLFLDEPTNGLDPQGQADMRALLASLPAEGRTVFVSSHALRDVEQMCTDLVIIDQGHKVAEGRVHDLLQQRARLSLRVSDVAAARGVLQRALPEVAFLEGEPHSVHLKPAGDADALAAAAVRALIQANLEVYAVASHTAELERYFLELTGPGQS